VSAAVKIKDSLAAVLPQTNQTLDEAVQEMIVLELYRRGHPYIGMTKDEWEAEKAVLDAWPRS
jgi:hypothetical protein